MARSQQSPKGFPTRWRSCSACRDRWTPACCGSPRGLPPGRAQSEALREGEEPDLLGLYEGATVLEHGLPERIVLCQRNHENVVSDDRELAEEGRETMRHEVGHHFGMGEDELPY